MSNVADTVAAAAATAAAAADPNVDFVCRVCLVSIVNYGTYSPGFQVHRRTIGEGDYGFEFIIRGVKATSTGVDYYIKHNAQLVELYDTLQLGIKDCPPGVCASCHSMLCQCTRLSEMAHRSQRILTNHAIIMRYLARAREHDNDNE